MARRKHRSQWGSVSYDPRKKIGVIRYWASLDSRGYMRHCKTVHGTRAEVEEERAKLLLLHSRDAPCPTVNDIYERYYAPAQAEALSNGDLVEKTVIQNRSNYNRHIKPEWGDMPLDQVKPLGVQQWLNRMGYTPAKVTMPVFRRIMTYGVRYGHIATNPLNESYDMPSKSTVNKRDDGIWDANTLPDVWRVFWDSWLEASVLLQGFGSCRFGESLAVKGTDVIDLSTHGIVVAGAVIDSQVDNRRNDVTRTKTADSVRVAVLAGYPAIRLLKLADTAGDVYITNDGFGKVVSQTKVRRTFEAMLKDSDVDYHLMKNLRKSWQTIARWKLRMEPRYTEPMMGHKVPGVTGTHYDRPSAEMFAEVLADHYANLPFADGLDWQLSTGYDWTWDKSGDVGKNWEKD